MLKALQNLLDKTIDILFLRDLTDYEEVIILLDVFDSLSIREQNQILREAKSTPKTLLQILRERYVSQEK